MSCDSYPGTNAWCFTHRRDRRECDAVAAAQRVTTRATELHTRADCDGAIQIVTSSGLLVVDVRGRRPEGR
jgi:hypothetical protein